MVSLNDTGEIEGFGFKGVGNRGEMNVGIEWDLRGFRRDSSH